MDAAVRRATALSAPRSPQLSPEGSQPSSPSPPQTVLFGPYVARVVSVFPSFPSFPSCSSLARHHCHAPLLSSTAHDCRRVRPFPDDGRSTGRWIVQDARATLAGGSHRAICVKLTAKIWCAHYRGQQCRCEGAAQQLIRATHCGMTHEELAMQLSDVSQTGNVLKASTVLEDGVLDHPAIIHGAAQSLDGASTQQRWSSAQP